MGQKLKILNISSSDLIGRRFNGFDWINGLKGYGVDSKLAVFWNKQSEQESVINFSPSWSTSHKKNLAKQIYRSYKLTGREDVEYPWSKDLLQTTEYMEADIIHFQIIQNGTLDFSTIKRILNEKRVVWTWHDPWPLTGHCVHPMACNRWAKGCGKCPDLERPFSTKKDMTKYNRRIKSEIFASGYNLHISSKWFNNLIQESNQYVPSPTIIPFGINEKDFKTRNLSTARQMLKIPDSKFVLFFRNTSEPYKNIDNLIEAIKLLPLNLQQNLTVLTVNEYLKSNTFPNHIDTKEFGWVDNQMLNCLYDASDLFVMPSLYETFGFMALEAAIKETPILVHVDTPMAEFLENRNSRLVVNMRNKNEICAGIQYIHDTKFTDIPLVPREQLVKKYGIEQFLGKLAVYYESVATK